MNASAFEPLTDDTVRHVARLARLRLSDVDVERYRQELSSILQYVAVLAELDVSKIEPLSHPLDLHSRIDRDEVAPPLSHADLARIAPMMEGPFVAVPKVLGGEAGGGA